MDGREQELCKNVDTKKELWGVIDIYGNVKGKIFEKDTFYFEDRIFYCSLGVVLTTPPQVIDGSRPLFNKYDQKPDKLPILYFTHLNPKTDLQLIGFSDVHGPELELFCQNMIAFRKSKHIV